MFITLSLTFGAVVGLALGLTGGGGSILAVPLLVYGLGTPPREAIGVSLLTVGTIALAGVVSRWLRGEVDLPGGLLFSLAAMVGTPIGVLIGRQLNDNLLLLGFAGLMGIVAVRLWKKAPFPGNDRETKPQHFHAPSLPRPEDKDARLGTADRETILSSTDTIHSPSQSSATPQRRWLVFLGASLLTGLLAGLFGIGGGFLIVPALVLVVRLDMHRAAATSLLVISLVSLSGTISHLLAGPIPAARITVPFIVGGIAGMVLGVTLSRYVSGGALQRLFAVILLAVSVVMVAQTLPQLWRSSVTYLRLLHPYS
jgi:uncharacterized membrane protein YfcA